MKISVFLKNTEKREMTTIREKNILLMNKNSEIESSIIDIIEGLRNYPLDPKVSKIEEDIFSLFLQKNITEQMFILYFRRILLFH